MAGSSAGTSGNCATPVEVVWQTITDPDQIERWTGNRPEIDPRPGGQYISHHRGGQTVVDRIARVEPPRLFEHTFWVDLNPTALVTWELAESNAGCHLTLTHALDLADVRNAAQTLGDDILLILSRNGAGWHRLLDKLTGTLDGRTPEWTQEDQQRLQARYATQLQSTT